MNLKLDKSVEVKSKKIFAIFPSQNKGTSNILLCVSVDVKLSTRMGATTVYYEIGISKNAAWMTSYFT